MMKYFISAITITLLTCSPVEAAAEAKSKKLDFARQILPILSNKCFVCHGPDTHKKDELRLDSYEAATRDLGGYKAIDPEDLGESELIIRIHDKDDPMPPDDAEKQLTDEERKLLTQWVKEGGQYAKHWAFVKPKKTPAKTSAQTGNPIDDYILEQLSKNKTGFAPEADKATLARRVALTLTGLPPEPKQLADFIADK